MDAPETKEAAAPPPPPPPPYSAIVPTRATIAAAVAQRRQELMQALRPLVMEVTQELTKRVVDATVCGDVTTTLDLNVYERWTALKLDLSYQGQLAMAVLREAFKECDFPVTVDPLIGSGDIRIVRIRAFWGSGKRSFEE